MKGLAWGVGGAGGQGGALDQSQDPEAGGDDAGIFQNKGKTSFSH